MLYSMSLGGPPSATMDAAVRKVTRRGIHTSVSAGNYGVNACGVSPARVTEAYVIYWFFSTITQI